ncbi:MAG: hypothetical protein E7305_08930 [Butyrivibrio sp.]|nr:hypothetical protein [Butyrivibrio sp.]
MRKKGFCRFYKDLLFGESVKNHQLVKWRLNHGRGQLSIFCIMKAQSTEDQLDIIHCAFLKQPYYMKNPAYIYGIAGSYNEALDMVVDMTTKANEAGFEGRIIDYLDSNF